MEILDGFENGIIGFVAGRTTSPSANNYSVNTRLRGRYIVRIYGISVYQNARNNTFSGDNCVPRYIGLTSNEWWFNQAGNIVDNKTWLLTYDSMKFYSPLIGEMLFSGNPITFSAFQIYNAPTNAELPATVLFYFDAINVNNLKVDKPLKLPTLCRFQLLNNATYGTTARREIVLPCRLNGRYRARFIGQTNSDNSANGVYRTNVDCLQIFSKELNDFGCINRDYATGGLLMTTRYPTDSVQVHPYPEFITNHIVGSVSFMLNSILGLATIQLLYLELWIEFYSLDDELEPLGTNSLPF